MTDRIGRRRILGTGLSLAAMGSLVACGGGGDDARQGSRNGVVPDPVAFLRTSWSTDPFARCSYSYLAPGRLGTRVRDLLAAPVAGRLHFAGEGTSAEAPATTHGALESGRRAAGEIVGAGQAGQHVVVVGSGFAGMGCARALTDAGFQVTVLEGRDRVGGRVWTQEIAGVAAEMGASWIHGSGGGNPMTQVLRETGGRSYRFDHDSATGFDDAAFAELARYQERLEEVEDPDDTPVSAVLPDHPSAALESAASLYYAQEYGADPDELAVSADDEGRAMEGPDLLLPDGYDTLLAHVRADVAVRTNAVVTAVRYGPDGVAVAVEGGEAIEADHAVITVPIGVLQAATIAFDPVLPDDKQEAIGALGAGLLDKLWLEFPEVFWNPDVDNLGWFDPDTPGQWSLWVNGHKAFGRPVLLGFNGGDRARDLADASDDDLVASALDGLRRMHAQPR